MQSFILLALLMMVTVEAFAPHPTSSSSAAAAAAGTTTTAVQYQNEGASGSATTATLVDFPVRTVVVPTKKFHRQSPTTTTTTAPASLPRTTRRTNTKPYIEELATLEELKYFLQDEDERPVVIKYYAKWCKKCQKVGQHFNRLAMEMGDQPGVEGPVRFAAVEYTPASQAFITEELKVIGLPTVQIYTGIHKVFDTTKNPPPATTTTTTASASSSPIQRVRQELLRLADLDAAAVLDHAATVDDGILATLIEDSFFDTSLDFLNEEW